MKDRLVIFQSCLSREMREVGEMSNVIHRPHLFQWRSAGNSPLKSRHGVSSLCHMKLRRCNSLRAWITNTGGLVLEMNGCAPDAVMDDLRHSYLCYMDKNSLVIGQVYLSKWLKNDVDSCDLQCDRHSNITIPIGTVLLKFILQGASGYTVLCNIPISRDERLLNQSRSQGRLK